VEFFHYGGHTVPQVYIFVIIYSNYIHRRKQPITFYETSRSFPIACRERDLR